MPETLNDLFDELSDACDLYDPPSPAAIDAVEVALGRTLPPELEAFYRRADGASVGYVDVFTLGEFVDVNRAPPPSLPAVFFFASDGADGFFLLDPAGEVGAAPGGVLWSERGHHLPADCVPCANDLASFLKRAAAGETPWLGPSVRDLDIRQMVEALESQHAGWQRRPGAEFEALHQAGLRVGALLPDELRELLSVSDGLVFPEAGVEVFGSSRLEPVAGAVSPGGLPGALWFAESDGARYAATISGWREPDGGKVVRVGRGQSPADGATVGTLPAVIRGWLAGEARY